MQMEYFNTNDFDDPKLNIMPNFVKDHVKHLCSEIFTIKNGKAVLIPGAKRQRQFIFAGKDLKVYKAYVYMDKAVNAKPGIRVYPVKEAEN